MLHVPLYHHNARLWTECILIGHYNCWILIENDFYVHTYKLILTHAPMPLQHMPIYKNVFCERLLVLNYYTLPNWIVCVHTHTSTNTHNCSSPLPKSTCQYTEYITEYILCGHYDCNDTASLSTLISEIYQIEIVYQIESTKLRFLGTSQFESKRRFWSNLTKYWGILISRFDGCQGCIVISGIC